MTPSAGLIPDSTYGAILLSLIDFFLSFVVIAFIGFVLLHLHGSRPLPVSSSPALV